MDTNKHFLDDGDVHYYLNRLVFDFEMESLTIIITCGPIETTDVIHMPA